MALTGSIRVLGIPSDLLARERTGSKASAVDGVLIGSPWTLPCFSMPRKTTKGFFYYRPLKIFRPMNLFTPFHCKAPRRVCKGRGVG